MVLVRVQANRADAPSVTFSVPDATTWNDVTRGAAAAVQLSAADGTAIRLWSSTANSFVSQVDAIKEDDHLVVVVGGEQLAVPTRGRHSIDTVGGDEESSRAKQDEHAEEDSESVTTPPQGSDQDQPGPPAPTVDTGSPSAAVSANKPGHPGNVHPHRRGQRNVSPSSLQGLGLTPTELYKTTLCQKFQDHGYCRYAEKCIFAHGVHEVREPPHPHPDKYKTKRCVKYFRDGFCHFGTRCHFIHPEDGIETSDTSHLRLLQDRKFTAKLDRGRERGAHGAGSGRQRYGGAAGGNGVLRFENGGGRRGAYDGGVSHHGRNRSSGNGPLEQRIPQRILRRIPNGANGGNGAGEARLNYPHGSHADGGGKVPVGPAGNVGDRQVNGDGTPKAKKTRRGRRGGRSRRGGQQQRKKRARAEAAAAAAAAAEAAAGGGDNGSQQPSEVGAPGFQNQASLQNGSLGSDHQAGLGIRSGGVGSDMAGAKTSEMPFLGGPPSPVMHPQMMQQMQYMQQAGINAGAINNNGAAPGGFVGGFPVNQMQAASGHDQMYAAAAAAGYGVNHEAFAAAAAYANGNGYPAAGMPVYPPFAGGPAGGGVDGAGAGAGDNSTVYFVPTPNGVMAVTGGYYYPPQQPYYGAPPPGSPSGGDHHHLQYPQHQQGPFPVAGGGGEYNHNIINNNNNNNVDAAVGDNMSAAGGPMFVLPTGGDVVASTNA